ncbi:MAG: rhomboid family intramembrane serine protease [Candidatus Solibacter usitatus]|nr:rhomboid family intramembrane serine protease [Candidatus Solibacter usitatus]
MDNRRMCPHCRAFITTKDRVCPYCEQEVGPRAVEMRTPGEVLGGLIPAAHFTTVMILLLNFGLYTATAVYSMGAGNQNAFWDPDLRTLLRFGAKYPPYILFRGEWWRLVTAGFLHGGVLHILFNSWAMYDLGATVEEFYGTSRFLVLYFLATIGGYLASTYWSGSVSVGASAGLFGLIGAMIALGVGSQTSMGAAIKAMYLRWAVYGLLWGLLPGFRVDNAAHIGGLATGFVCAYLSGTPRRQSSEQAWTAAAWVCGLITAYCFFRMYLSFSSFARPIGS